MDDRILHHLTGVDEIWHAGDIGELLVIDQLAQKAKVLAVYGNIDDHKVRAEHPQMRDWQFGQQRILMLHIGGRPGRYASGVRRLLKEKSPDVFICGHSHLLRVEKDASWGGLYVNPGAAGLHGFHRVRTLLRFSLHPEFGISQMEVVELGGR
jgi:putative phosphoesterase